MGKTHQGQGDFFVADESPRMKSNSFQGLLFLLSTYPVSFTCMALDVGAVLSLLVAFQLSFMAWYLFNHKKGNRRNNRILAYLFLMFAINLFDFTARITGIILPVPLLHLLDDSFFLLYGPVFYLYTMAVVYKDFQLNRRHLIHGMPALLMFGYGLLMVFSIDFEQQSAIIGSMETSNIPIWATLLGFSFYVHIMIYLWRSWRVLKAYRVVVKDQYSTIDGINLDWLRFMLRIFLVLTIIAAINNMLPVFGNIYFLYLSIILLLLFSFYFINRVLVKALNQPALFSGIAQNETKYAGSTLDRETLEQHKIRLVDLMVNHRLYLDTNLKSADLAITLNISTKELSQVINQGFNKNFFDFVNAYRCEEVKRILQKSDQKTTILEAMYQAGFNSKSSFNKEFKKLTGQTPGEFKRSLS